MGCESVYTHVLVLCVCVCVRGGGGGGMCTSGRIGILAVHHHMYMHLQSSGVGLYAAVSDFARKTSPIGTYCV